MSSLDESPSGRYPEGKLPCFLPEVRTFYDIVKYDYIGFHFLSDASWPSWAAQLQRQLTGITPQNSDSKDKIYNQIEKISSLSLATQPSLEERTSYSSMVTQVLPGSASAVAYDLDDLLEVCGLLGFAILSMRLGYFVKKNADVKLKVKQGEQAFPDDDEGHEVQVATDGMPWKLADRMDWVVIILGTPLIFIAQGQERFAHGAYMVLGWKGSKRSSTPQPQRYMRIVAYTAVQGVYAFVFIGVLRTIFDIAVTYISEMPKYHEQETYRTDALFTLDKFDHRKGT
ncbi:unnamed protein product [Durusdinium trenchii]|uniref:Uncharacterized protein n=1 Tax=Durusdinium trenchii TaxID=1381693 RepID=A0ABP0NI64_9DINO